MNNTSLRPRAARLESIDVIRGFALLGILIMNIQSFSMISAAYLNPTAYGDLNGINRTVWVLSHLLADQKFLSLFSMLFGVGIILFSDNIKARGYLPARFFYRRLFWLFTFGLIHGYLLWHGDILVAYAVCGALAFLFRRLNAYVLLSIGLVFFFIPSFNYYLFGKSLEMWPPEALENLRTMWAPGAEVIRSEVQALTGSLSEQLVWRIPETFKMETFIFVIYMGWRAFACMLIGMALYRLGFFEKTLSKRTYWIMTLAGLGLGAFLIYTGIRRNFAADWTVEYSMFFGWQWNYYGSLLMALGYAAMLMIVVRFVRLQLLAKVGRMAFTNYILTTLIGTFLFYGHGLGLFGQVERWHQMLIVVAIWTVLLLFSWLWLKKYRYGPLEWLWRYLTYGNKPQMLRK